MAIGSIDLLLERASPEARSLLWIVTLASESVHQAMLQGVWSGQTPEQEQAGKLKNLLELYDRLPAEARTDLPEISAEMRTWLESTPDAPPVPPVEPLLVELCDAGLLGRDTDDSYSFHELVRERTEAWMQHHPEESRNRVAEAVWRAYGERYQALFDKLRQSGKVGAQDAAAEAGRRGLNYLVRARAFEALGSFASKLVTETRDPAWLTGVIAELEAIVSRFAQI